MDQNDEFHGPTVKKHLSRDYVGLIVFDESEKLYIQFWVSRSGFLVTLIFDFLTLGGSLILTRCAISLKYAPKI